METYHGKTSTDTGVRSLKTELLGNLDKTGGGSLSWLTLGLVDLGKHGVGWLGNKGSSETSNKTTTKVDTGLGSVGEGGLVNHVVNSLIGLLENDELSHGVWNPWILLITTTDVLSWQYLLLEENWSETGVESTDTLVLQHLGEATDKAVGVGWVRDQTNTSSLEWAKGDISEELGDGRGGQVDGGTVVDSILVTDEVDSLLLEKLVTSELEGSLEEVTGSGWTETGQKSTSTLLGDNLLETADETAVVGDWVKLNSGLDAVKAVSSCSHS